MFSFLIVSVKICFRLFSNSSFKFQSQLQTLALNTRKDFRFWPSEIFTSSRMKSKKMQCVLIAFEVRERNP